MMCLLNGNLFTFFFNFKVVATLTLYLRNIQSCTNFLPTKMEHILLTWPNFISDDDTYNFGLRIAYDSRLINV